MSVCSKQNCKKIKHSKQFTPSSAHITSFQPIVGQSGTENFADEQILNELKQLSSNFTNMSERVSNIEQLHNTTPQRRHAFHCRCNNINWFSGCCKHSNLHCKHRPTSCQQIHPLDPHRIRGFTITVTHRQFL